MIEQIRSVLNVATDKELVILDRMVRSIQSYKPITDELFEAIQDRITNKEDFESLRQTINQFKQSTFEAWTSGGIMTGAILGPMADKNNVDTMRYLLHIIDKRFRNDETKETKEDKNIKVIIQENKT